MAGVTRSVRGRRAFPRRSVGHVGAVERDRDLSISFSTYGERALADRVRAELGPSFPQLRENPERRHGSGYYTPLAIRIDRVSPEGLVEVGDGGFVSWTAQLAADAKERCLVFCVSTERLLPA